MMVADSAATKTSRCLIAAWLLGTIVMTGCGIIGDDGPSRQTLDAFVKTRASREEIAASLGRGYTWYAPDSEAWAGLVAALEREPKHLYGPVREAMRDRKAIMYYTTAWQQTWLILSSDGRVERYWTNSQ
jgi:hypothetical protein